MLRPEYQHQYNNGIYQDIMVRNAIQESVPSMKRVFQESVRYAFEDNTFMHAKDYLRTLQTPEDSKLKNNIIILFMLDHKLLGMKV